ncbi:MAG: CoA transferase, partial [Chloroflexi bacterium]|nr:CoA transferase [Chloroflexota bacterium]
GGMPGALAAMMLGDHGAEVVKLESPGGDPMISEAGSRFWNRSKRRIALDLHDPHQRAQAWELVRRADVLILGLRRATAEAWGLTYEHLSQENPGLVVATITGMGWDGPHQDDLAVDGMINAVAGAMNSPQNGPSLTGPIFVASRLAGYGAAMACAQGVLAALHVRTSTGTGQHVDTSLLQGILYYRGPGPLKVEYHADELPVQPAARDPRGMRPLFNLNQCADGRWLAMAAWTPVFSKNALTAMGLAHLLDNPKFATMPNVFPDDAARWELLTILWDAFRTKTQQEWVELMDQAGVPCEPVLSVEEFRRHPQLWANDLAVTVNNPVVGAMIQPGIVGELSETPGEIRAAEAEARPAAAVQETLERWGRQTPAAHPPSGIDAAQRFRRGPLTDVTVLDFTAFLAGPTCSKLLADLGADVIKVETKDGDDFRTSAKTGFLTLTRGKRCVVLNLRVPGAQEALHRLVRKADVVVYNYRLGVEDRLGLDYPTLRKINPNIIVCRMTAFGTRGDRAHRPAYDSSISALSGHYVQQAGEGNPPPSAGAADISTGIAATTAILAALRAKDMTGKGQAVEATMIGAMSYVMADSFTDYESKPPTPRLDRGQYGLSPLYRLYPTAEEGWLLLAAVREKDWSALLQALNVPALQSEAFASPQGRRQHADQLAEILEGVFRQRPATEWLAALRRAQVPCADPTGETATWVMNNQELRAGGGCIEVDHPYYGKITQAGPSVHFSLTPSRIAHVAPALGGHTEEVLAEVGMTPEEVSELVSRGAALAAPSKY